MPRCQLDARDKEWFWKMAAGKFNQSGNVEIDFNLFRNDEPYPEELRKFYPYSREGCTVTASKLETAFPDVRSTLMKVMSNFRKSEIAEKADEDLDPDQPIDSSNFFNFFSWRHVYILFILLFGKIRATSVHYGYNAQGCLSQWDIESKHI